MIAESGLIAPVPAAPNSRANSTGMARNCQAEIPAARATTSSEERDSRQNAKIPPSSTAKGRICSSVHGTRNSSISTMMPKLAAGAVADSRSSSRKSNRLTRAERAASIIATAAANCRPKYIEIVNGMLINAAPAARAVAPRR